ncbi:uronyl 2-sulfotransferase-like [Ptychodera flava]|uniref:uronyl 2-sulfotransferase-like n=1 Tax=Ptychodera flava TaxID=63121 RepID=UPI00396A0626
MVTTSMFQAPRRSVFASLIVAVITCAYVYCVYSDGTHFTNHRMSPEFDTGNVVHDFSNATSDENTTDLIFYNKVGKCGSRTLVYLFRKLARKNKFVASGQSKTPQMSRYMTEHEQAQLVERISNLPRPATFYRHTNFIDFRRFGHKNPIYINVVRRPLNRLVSEYYFKRFGDDKNDTKNFPGEGKYETFDDCVLLNRNECLSSSTFIIIPYFCGQVHACRNVSRWALETAKENVIKYFTFVGISEEFEDTLKLLEIMFPRFFNRALEIYKTPGAIISTKTKGKVPPSPLVEEIMNERLALENEFYEFIKQRFYSLKAKYGIAPSSSGTNRTASGKKN